MVKMTEVGDADTGEEIVNDDLMSFIN